MKSQRHSRNSISRPQPCEINSRGHPWSHTPKWSEATCKGVHCSSDSRIVLLRVGVISAHRIFEGWPQSLRAHILKTNHHCLFPYLFIFWFSSQMLGLHCLLRGGLPCECSRTLNGEALGLPPVAPLEMCSDIDRCIAGRMEKMSRLKCSISHEMFNLIRNYQS